MKKQTKQTDWRTDGILKIFNVYSEYRCSPTRVNIKMYDFTCDQIKNGIDTKVNIFKLKKNKTMKTKEKKKVWALSRKKTKNKIIIVSFV